MKHPVRFILIVLFCGLSACATKRPLAPMMYEYELSEAQSLIKAHKFHQAIDELNMLIQMFPKEMEAMELRALSYQKLNRFDRAIADYKKVIHASKKAPKSHYNLAMIYAYKTNDRRKALHHFDRFLTVAPYHKEAFSVAKIMITIDQELNSAQLIAPHVQSIIQAAASIKKPAEKRAVLKKGIEALPNSPIFYFLMAQAYEEEGQKKNLEEARTFYQLALDRRPTSARAHRSLGKLYAKAGKDKASRIHLRKAELFDPKSSS